MWLLMSLCTAIRLYFANMSIQDIEECNVYFI